MMFVHDLRQAARQWRTRPGVCLLAVFALAAGIGANSAIFTFVNALLLRPFPFAEPERLVEIRSVRGGQPSLLSMREVLDIRDTANAVEQIAAHTTAAGGYNYSGAGEGKPEEWRAILATGNLFDVLGVRLAQGSRWPQHSDRERDFRVVLTHHVWQRSFGGKPDAIGRSITLDHAPGYQVHGVAPAHFDYPQGVEVYRSLGGFANYDKRSFRNVVAVARLRPSASVAMLQSQLDAMAVRLSADHPDTNRGLTFQATSLRDLFTGDVRPYLLTLSGAVGFVLLIACANVVNLLLGVAIGRSREIAVRTALGASRFVVLRQLLTEGVALGAVAGVTGLVLAWWMVRFLRTIVGSQMPEWIRVELDLRVLLFTSAVALIAGMAAGLAPALQVSGVNPAGALREGGRGGSMGRSPVQFRDALVVAQVALTLILLAGAGLLIRSFDRLQTRDNGFHADGVTTFRVALGWRRYGAAQTIRYYEQALQKLREVKAFESVAFASNPPLTRQEESETTTVQRDGQSMDDALVNPFVIRQGISENYFEAMRIPLRGGRSFTQFDGASSEPVGIVSERLAKRLWPNQDPVGRLIRPNPSAPNAGPFRKVIGVAADVRQRATGDTEYALYVPYRQQAEANQYLLIRTRLPLTQARTLAEQALWSIDSEQSLFDFQMYSKRILDNVWQLRLSRALLSWLSGLALLLSAIGVYGVMAFLVRQRTRELSIRMALGATPREIQRQVVVRGLIPGAIAVAVGIPVTLLLSRMLASALDGVTPIDWPSLAAVTLLLLGSIVAASLVPAIRAARTDLVKNLKAE